ncbi:very short patch repair endonuclease [Saccharopolyspora thermophila]|uniref:very short patch repair endonuclease n=1 Tax=Saccharopolyspora thermophila TaxID=89367 RepID=UPI0031F9A332
MISTHLDENITILAWPLKAGSQPCPFSRTSRRRPVLSGEGVTLHVVLNDADRTTPSGSWASSAGRRRNMQAIRNRDTAPEWLIRRLLHARGLRYRVCARPLPELRRTADLVFRPAKVAVFIDGCYWHGCPEHYKTPRINTQYWSNKVARNIARDRDTDQRLAEAGWLVLRFWEHEKPEKCVHEIANAVSSRRNRFK